MKFTTQKSDLIKALRVARVADARGAIPIVGNVLISMLADCVVELTATDLKLGTTESLSVEGDLAHAGDVSIANAKQLVAAVKSMPDGPLRVVARDGHLDISQGKTRVKIARLGEADAADFPPSPDIPNGPELSDTGREASIKRSALIRALKKVRYAAANDWSRPHLSGALFAIKKGTITIVATDGHRLALAKSEAIDGELTALVPLRALDELVNFLESEDGSDVLIVVDGSLALFVCGARLWTQLTTEKFPPYQKVIPSQWQQEVTVDAVDMLTSLRRVSSVLSSRSAAVIISLEEGSATLKLSSSDKDTQASAEDFVELEREASSSIEIHVNGAYLAETLAACGEGSVELRTSKQMDPVVIAAGEDVHVLMPMRG